jgi:hypothetical protein
MFNQLTLEIILSQCANDADTTSGWCGLVSTNVIVVVISFTVIIARRDVIISWSHVRQIVVAKLRWIVELLDCRRMGILSNFSTIKTPQLSIPIATIDSILPSCIKTIHFQQPVVKSTASALDFVGCLNPMQTDASLENTPPPL